MRIKYNNTKKVVMHLEIYILVAAFLMLLSVVSSKLSSKFGIPALFIFLGLGMLAGSEGILGIHFEDVAFAQSVGIIALIFILFGGGLDTSFKAIRPILKEGLLLATLGVFFTALCIAVVIYYTLEFTFLESLLLGAIVSSTDAAAVFAILRAKGIALKKGLGPLLELESGSNDPMAIFLTVAVLQIILMPHASSISEWIVKFLLQFLLGGVLGFIFGFYLPRILNKIHLSFYGLYPVFTIAWVLLLFAAASSLGGNGFLAVYIAGIVANTKSFVHKTNLIGFHDGLAWIMQIMVFLTLGLLVFPSNLLDVAWQGLIIALCLIFIARPIGVFLSLALSHYNFKQKLFVSWVGLRGAVPIVLATYPYIEGLENAELIFNTVFFLVLISILIQGTTIPFMARLLGVEVVKQSSFIRCVDSSPLFYHSLRQVYIDYDSNAVDKNLVELTLPENFLVLMIKRGNNYIKPTSDTLFEEGDVLLVQCEKEQEYQQGLQKFIAT